MKKSVFTCIAILFIAFIVSVSFYINAVPSSSLQTVAPETGDLNLLIIIPAMLIAAFLIFLIIKRRR